MYLIKSVNCLKHDVIQKLICFFCRFVPDKEFSGTDRVAGSSRSGPVQFEKDEEDPFGLDQFLTQAKKASKRGADESSKDKGSSSSSSDKRRRRD